AGVQTCALQIWQETPDIPENTVTVLGAEIAEEQPPRKLARSQQVGNHVADELRTLPQGRFRRVHRHRMVAHRTLDTAKQGADPSACPLSGCAAPDALSWNRRSGVPFSLHATASRKVSV